MIVVVRCPQRPLYPSNGLFTCSLGRYNATVLSFPFLIFWIIMVLGRHELGWKGVLISVSIWFALLVGFAWAGISPYVFVSAQALLDAVLILIIFKGDIRIR